MPSPIPFDFAAAAPYIKILRDRNPLVHCMTNDVVQAFTANVLLAIGACPAMIVEAEEVEGFVACADALLINVGTITKTLAHSMALATDAAVMHQKPWVMDPVALGILPYRAGVVSRLLQAHPAVIRGNPAEILFMAGQASMAKGPDSQNTALSALNAAQGLAVRCQCVVAVTGEIDFITNGLKTYSVHGGHINLTRVTGTGCSLSAIVAAFVGCPGVDRLAATASACLLMKTAGQLAGSNAGLGSFAAALLDQLTFLSDPLRA